MNYVFVIAVGLIFLLEKGLTEPPYVVESNVPDPQYDIDAITEYNAAFNLHPPNDELFYKIYSELFNAKHAIPGGWKIAENCGVFYNPTSNYTYIIVQGNDDAGNRTIRIFS